MGFTARFINYAFQASQSISNTFAPIYHTNVMMSVGTNFCVICLESISDDVERAAVEQQLLQSGKEVIAISRNQMHHFAGNILEVKNTKGDPIICMSQQALDSFSADQIKRLEFHAQLCASPLYAIEKYGGGSARCKMAEVFL